MTRKLRKKESINKWKYDSLKEKGKTLGSKRAHNPHDDNPCNIHTYCIFHMLSPEQVSRSIQDS